MNQPRDLKAMPRAAASDLVSYQLVKYLEDRGVEHVFGLCGHTNIAVLAELAKSSIRFVNTRHEQVAAHMADGYARAKRRTAVVLSHLGPGLTNASTGVANAALDSIPLVVIAGDVPSHYYGKHPHQEVNLHADASQYEIYRPFVKRAWRVERPDLFPEIIDKAFQLAESGRPGPVLVSVPMDIFSRQVDPELFGRLAHHTKALHKPSIDDETAARMVEAMAGAARPLIYAGGGVLLADAADELREFAAHFSIPVAHSLMGKGALPDDHPLTLGMTGFWGTEFINRKCSEADSVLALGTRFAEADCSSWDPRFTFRIPPARLTQIDIDPAEIGRNFPVEIGAVADLKQALRVMLRVAKQRYPAARRNDALVKEIAAYRRAFAQSNEAHIRNGAYPMRPERILAEVREVLPRDALITTDVGWNKNGVGQQFPITVPGTFITPSGLATMGFGPAAALGVKLAQPDRAVVALIGDGAFGSNPSVVATAMEAGLGVIWLVMDNAAFGTIAGLTNMHYGWEFGCLFESEGSRYRTDFAQMAKGYGADGVFIRSADELGPSLTAALASGRPTVIQAPMENAPTPTPGHWDINCIYRKGS